MKVKSGREDEILAAAARIFREKGYHGTSVRDIAEAVGLLKGSLYHYIRSKDELLARLFEGLLEDTVRELGSIVARDASPEARLRDMVRAYADAVMAHHDAVGLYLREWRSLPPAELAGLGARRRRTVDDEDVTFASRVCNGVLCRDQLHISRATEDRRHKCRDLARLPLGAAGGNEGACAQIVCTQTLGDSSDSGHRTWIAVPAP